MSAESLIEASQHNKDMQDTLSEQKHIKSIGSPAASKPISKAKLPNLPNIKKSESVTTQNRVAQLVKQISDDVSKYPINDAKDSIQKSETL